MDTSKKMLSNASMFTKKQETVKVDDYKKRMGYVQAQPHTHFRLKNKSERAALLHAIGQVQDTGGSIVGQYDYGRQHNADIIIQRKGGSDEPIGKIHMLLFNKGHRYDSRHYYIDLHFFQFINDTLFDHVKAAVMKFFNELPPLNEPYINSESARKSMKNKITNKRNTYKSNKKIDEGEMVDKMVSHVA